MSKDAAKLKASSYRHELDRKSTRKAKKPLVVVICNYWKPYPICAAKKFMDLDSKSVLYLVQEPPAVINTHNLGSNINNWLKTRKPTFHYSAI